MALNPAPNKKSKVDFTNVYLDNPQDGDVFQYQAARSAWTNAPQKGGTITEVDTGTGLTGGPITSSGTIALATSGAGAQTYTYPASVVVDAYGG